MQPEACYFEIHVSGESFPGSPALRAARSRVRHGHLRSQWRSHQTQAAAGALPAGLRAPPGCRIRRARHLAHAHDRRPVPRENAGVRQGIPGGFAVRRRRLDRLRPGHLLHGGQLRRRRTLSGAGRPAEGNRSGAPHRRQRAVLSFHAAQPVYPHRARHRRRERGQRRVRLAPHRHRKAFRPRSGQRAQAERRTAQRLRRIRGLPHRSLPGQGDGAEHPGIPLRQRHLRAALEPPLRESRADHGRRIDRRGRPRRVLPGSRRAARHDPESPVAGDGHHRHGAERHLPPQLRARRALQAAAFHPRDEAGRSAAEHRFRASMARRASAAKMCPASARNRA